MSKFWIINLFTVIFSIILLYGFLLLYLNDEDHTEYVHKILYIDREFNDDDIEVFLESTWEWSKATNNRVIYDIAILPWNEINYDNGILINKLTEDNINIIKLDEGSKRITLAYYHRDNSLSHIGVVTERIPPIYFKSVIMHEIGHSLGLPHNEGDDGIGTLMYPYIELAADNISNEDVINYCILHKCK